MREVMCIIRSKKINETKRALAENGFPAFTCRKCSGRGKTTIDPELLSTILEAGELPVSDIGESITEAKRLIAKRVITLIVDDDDVQKVVDVVIEANQTGNSGDGKIFVLPVLDSYTISTGESTAEAY